MGGRISFSHWQEGKEVQQHLGIVGPQVNGKLLYQIMEGLTTRNPTAASGTSSNAVQEEDTGICPEA